MECIKLKLFKIDNIVFIKEKCRLIFNLSIPLKKGRGYVSVFPYESYDRVKPLLDTFVELGLKVEEQDIEQPRRIPWRHSNEKHSNVLPKEIEVVTYKTTDVEKYALPRANTINIV